MRFFLAGIMQGSHLGAVLHNQDYRSQLNELLREYFPGADIYDPLADHANSIEYDDDSGREVFFHHNRLCREVDVVIAFVPEASMGTAIEMWEAHQHGAAVVAVSPLVHNWAIRFCSHAVYADLAALAADLKSGRLQQTISEVLAHTSEESEAVENGWERME